MLVAQGHDRERAMEIAAANRAASKAAAGAASDGEPPMPEPRGAVLVATIVPCIGHGRERGQTCSYNGVCQGRKRAAAAALSRGTRVIADGDAGHADDRAADLLAGLDHASVMRRGSAGGGSPWLTSLLGFLADEP
jgi:hypothetical protein